MSGTSDANITFDELAKLVTKLGFKLKAGARSRSGSSHRVFYKDGVDEIVNLQEGSNGKAKGYQIRQVRDVVKKYNLKPE